MDINPRIPADLVTAATRTLIRVVVVVLVAFLVILQEISPAGWEASCLLPSISSAAAAVVIARVKATMAVLRPRETRMCHLIPLSPLPAGDLSSHINQRTMAAGLMNHTKLLQSTAIIAHQLTVVVLVEMPGAMDSILVAQGLSLRILCLQLISKVMKTIRAGRVVISSLLHLREDTIQGMVVVADMISTRRRKVVVGGGVRVEIRDGDRYNERLYRFLGTDKWFHSTWISMGEQGSLDATGISWFPGWIWKCSEKLR